MSKTFLITPVFGKAALLSQFLDHVYKTPPENVTHVIVDAHYPVDHDANHLEVKRLAEQYGCTYIDAEGDKGLQANLNLAVEKMGITRDDYFIGCDMDDRPSPGFVDALRDVMSADPKVAVCALSFWVIDERINQGKMTEDMIGGRRVYVHPGVEMFNIVAFNMGLVHDAGGFSQPNAFYGGIELALHRHWHQSGMKLVYLPDVRADYVQVDRNDRNLFDPEYGQWKIAHATQGFRGSFADFLAVNK